jgi:hypothetical protein
MRLLAWFRRYWRLRRERLTTERYERDLAVWQGEHNLLAGELALALDPTRLEHTDGESSVVLRKNEFALLIMTGAALVEPKRLPGQWVGSYSGVSLRVMRGVTVHTGSSRGTYVPGPEAPAAIAVGTATVTNQRVIFQSSAQAREFAFAKLLGYQHDPTSPLTFFQVSNRQKVSGVGYDRQAARVWRFRLALALALFHDDLPKLVSHVRDDVEQQLNARPSAPLIGPPI